MHEREISPKCRWLRLLKLIQKMRFGTYRPVSLLSSTDLIQISLPSLPPGEHQTLFHAVPLATKSSWETVTSCILENITSVNLLWIQTLLFKNSI